jgi:hypothetical protein
VLAQISSNAAANAKPAKYRNKAEIVDGIRFSSRLEASCYRELKLRQSAGEVAWFVRQVRFDLPGNVRYFADFLAVLTQGHGVEVIDAKGRDTEVSRIKRKLVEATYGCRILLWPQRDLKL